MRSARCLGTWVGVAMMTALCSSTAFASNGGVVFLHGTSDHAGTQTCSGTGDGWTCRTGDAATGYWNQGTINSMRTRSDGTMRPYAVVGFRGGSGTPWYNASPARCTSGFCGTGGALAGQEPAEADSLANQIDRFIKGPDGVYGTADDITDIVFVTHSGGANWMRFILQQYAASTARSHVKTAAKKVITIAGPFKGTYLADQVFKSGSFINTVNRIVMFFGGSGFYNDDGTNFIRTTNMSSYNADSAKFVNLSEPVNGVVFRETGGVSGTKCYGVTVWGACIGIKGPTLGGSSCDSGLTDTALLALHTLYLNTNDSATARDKCSDGFISCASARGLGGGSSTYYFNFNQKQDHNQSRRQCHGEDVAVRNEVNGTAIAYENTVYPETDVPPTQWDACGFRLYAGVYNSSGSRIGYTSGCSNGLNGTYRSLGDGYCDWDCLAIYGHDAVPTYDSQGHITAWGTSDDCSNTSMNTANTYTSAATCSVDADCAPDPFGALATCVSGRCTFNYTDTSNDPWSDYAAYTSDGSSYYRTQFTGKTQNGSSTVWFTDPNHGSTLSAGYCPQSWIGDGVCDECVLALYGADGDDCLPGRISACGGMITMYNPYSTTSNPIYNEGDPSTNGTTWYFWNTMPAVAGNGVCENSECTPNKASPCTTSSDCLGGTCSSTGYCSISDSFCDTSADCQSGTCVNGGCTTQGTDCSATTAAGTAISLCR